MATSPNYSWPEPDNTDLVKNGALAMRTLGNAIDTTMATMTPKSTYTAKGSIAAATGASTPANLAVGNNGETLVADSSATTGLRYTSNFAAGKNAIINGAMYWSQRGTTFTNPANGAYTLDRWRQYADGTISQVISQQTFTPGTAPVAGYEGTYYLRKVVSSASGASYNNIEQGIEDVRTFAGQTVTVSFWAKADATRTITPNLTQSFGSGGSGGVATSGSAISLTTSWVRYTQTLTLPSIAGKTIGTNSQLVYTISCPTNTAFTIDIWGAQLEAGSVATAFQTASGSIGGELALCQRYYVRPPLGTAESMGIGFGNSVTNAYIQVRVPVTLRTSATAIDYGGTFYIENYLISAKLVSAMTLTNVGYSINLLNITAATGLTTGTAYGLTASGAGAYIGFSAEL